MITRRDLLTVSAAGVAFLPEVSCRVLSRSLSQELCIY